MDRVQVSGKETRKIYYRNDPVKYDLDLPTAIPLVFERFKGRVLGLDSRAKQVYSPAAYWILLLIYFRFLATLSK